MKVADLRQHLADLARLMEATGAKAVAADLVAIQEGLAPFNESPLKGFAEFLVRAEAYSRGEVPVAPPSRKRATSGGRPPSTKAPPVDVEALVQEAKDLYARAADPAVTAEAVEALAGRLKAPKKDDLVRVAEGVGLVGMKAKAKDKIVEAIRARILDRKGAAVRVGINHRPMGEAAPSPGDGSSEAAEAARTR